MRPASEGPGTGAEPGPRSLVVTIAGRPNAGKSTLFNRLLRRRVAITDGTPGVTRDENRARTERSGRVYEIVDTGGIEERALGEGLAERVHRRSLDALRRADVVVYLVDGRAGLAAPDRAVAATIRALGVPTILAVNKVDRPDQEAKAIDFLELGDHEPVAVSAAHGIGIGELWERIDRALDAAGHARPVAEPERGEDAGIPDEDGAADRAPDDADGEGAAAPPDADPDRPARIALVGRPNVGKSSLLNRIVGYERALVDAVAGTTRDSIDVEIERGGRSYVVVDTAGLRRPSRVVETIEGHAAAASIRAISRAEVAVLVLDATVGVTDQDLRLADLVWRRGRGFVVVVNKVDLAPDLAAEQCHDTIARRLPQWPPLPLVRASALEGKGLKTLFAAIDTVVGAYRRRISTPRLNALLARVVEIHPPALVSGKPVKILYAAHVRSAPHEVAVFVNRVDGLTTDYQRYLTNHLRAEFGLVGVPIKLAVRARTRPPREGHAPGTARKANPARARSGVGNAKARIQGKAGGGPVRGAPDGGRNAAKPALKAGGKPARKSGGKAKAKPLATGRRGPRGAGGRRRPR